MKFKLKIKDKKYNQNTKIYFDILIYFLFSYLYKKWNIYN